MARWVADDGRKHPRHAPRWRPFYRTLQRSSQYQAMVIIDALFAWLVQAGYPAGNPLPLSRQRARRSRPRTTHYLDRELWTEVKLYIDSLPKDTPRERSGSGPTRSSSEDQTRFLLIDAPSVVGF